MSTDMIAVSVITATTAEGDDEVRSPMILPWATPKMICGLALAGVDLGSRPSLARPIIALVSFDSTSMRAQFKMIPIITGDGSAPMTTAVRIA